MSDDQTYYASEYTIYYFHKNNIYIRGERFTNSPNRGNKFGDRRKMERNWTIYFSEIGN